MHALEKMFPSLTLFSDLNWDQVTQEYEAHYIDISFPEYLQQKAIDGDCPPYLFELAFFELALFDAKTSSEPYPHQPGIYLNPTSLFLSLEFDVKRMLDEAAQGKIEVYEREHVVSIYRDTHDKIHVEELSEVALDLLQHLEDGPLPNKDFVEDMGQYNDLKKMGLILEIT